MAFKERIEGEFFIPYFSAKPLHSRCKRILPFLWSQPNACIIAEIVHSVFCEFIVNLNIVVSFHHKMAMQRCFGNDEIERQLKCKICDMVLYMFGCFKKYHRKERYSYMMRGVKHVYTASR
jgi:hypothetical protein